MASCMKGNSMQSRRRGRIGLGIVASGVLIFGGIAPAANADAARGADDSTVTALTNLGLLAPVAMARSVDSLAAGSGVLTSADGLTVELGNSTLSMKPATRTEPRLASGALVYESSRGYSYALTGHSSAADAGYVVIDQEDAPRSYAFEISANGEPAVLELMEGRVLVKDALGDVVNVISPAWAVDAAGNDIATTYSVSGSTLTQYVEHHGAAYPVVADPRVACSGLFCTLELTKKETGQLADNALNAGVVCGITGPAVVLCTAAVLAGWAQANVARNTGQCFGTRWANYPLPNGFHNVYIRCYA